MARMELEQLKLLLGQKGIPEILHTHLLSSDPICFSGNKDLIYELQKSLSEHFDVHTKNIEIVGSAKLGFSLNPQHLGKRYRKDSDIDLVIVSTELFDKAWRDLVRLDGMRHSLSSRDLPLLESSFKTIHQGLISPDRLPPRMDFYKNWWSIFEKLSNEEGKFENRKIRGRLFKDWWFVERYYSIVLAKLSQNGV